MSLKEITGNGGVVEVEDDYDSNRLTEPLWSLNILAFE